MKSNEIKKGLAWYSKDNGSETSYLITETLAYIQDLEAENKAMHKLLEKRKKEKDNLIKTYAECQKEAIKEFMDSLKAKAQNANTWTGIEPVVTISDIEDTAKDLLIDDNVTK